MGAAAKAEEDAKAVQDQKKSEDKALADKQAEMKALDAEHKAEKDAQAIEQRVAREEAAKVAKAAEKAAEQEAVLAEAERIEAEDGVTDKAEALTLARVKVTEDKKKQQALESAAADEKRQEDEAALKQQMGDAQLAKEADQAKREQDKRAVKDQRTAKQADRMRKEVARNDTKMAEFTKNKSEFATACGEAHAQAMARMEAYKQWSTDLEGREKLVASVYKSITKEAIVQVKDKLTEWGIPMTADEKCTRPALVPLPKDVRKISYEKMFRHYSDTWLCATPCATPRNMPALPAAPWAHCQKAATEIESNVTLEGEQFEKFKIALADKMDLDTAQLSIIIEAVT